MNEEKKVKTNVYIEAPQKTINKLKELAKKEKRPLGMQILVMLEKHLPTLEPIEKDETITKINIPIFIEKTTLETLDTIGHNNNMSRSQVVAKFLTEYNWEDTL